MADETDNPKIDFYDIVDALENGRKKEYHNNLYIVAKKQLMPFIRSRWAGVYNLDTDQDIMQKVQIRLFQYAESDFFKRKDLNGQINRNPEGFAAWLTTVAKSVMATASGRNELPTDDDDDRLDTVPDSSYYDQEIREFDRDVIENAFKIVMDADSNAYIVMTWIAHRLFYYDNDSSKKSNEEIIIEFSYKTLYQMRDYLYDYSKRLGWMTFTPDMKKKIEKSLNEKTGRIKIGGKEETVGDQKYATLFTNKTEKDTISDWVNRIDVYVKDRMSKDGEEIKFNQDVLEKAFEIAMDADSHVYIVMTWIAYRLFSCDNKSDEKPTEKIIKKFSYKTLYQMRDYLYSYSKKLGRITFAPGLAETMEKALNEKTGYIKTDGGEETVGDLKYGTLFLNKIADDAISDWVNRIDVYVKDRMSKDGEEIKFNQDVLEKAFEIAMDADSRIYVIMTWIAYRLFFYDNKSSEKSKEKIINIFSKKNLYYMRDCLTAYSKNLSTEMFTPDLIEKINTALDEKTGHWKADGRKETVGDLKYGAFFIGIIAKATVSDWVNRLDVYVNDRMDGDGTEKDPKEEKEKRLKKRLENKTEKINKEINAEEGAEDDETSNG